jgi:predicted  nucleic acid-binding Zn-ribbon protein
VKVAELTQVVHMLFTRNHEKEVEIEALKEAYEFEITDVISDARQRIADLEGQLEESIRQQSTDTDRVRKLLEGEFQDREKDLKARLEDAERQLQEERSECQNLR